MERVTPMPLSILPSHHGLYPHEIFNKLNICYRECSTFVPSSDDPKICVCQRPESAPVHDSRNRDVKGAKWTMEHNTVRRPDPDFGQLKEGAHFARLALDTPLRKTEQILFDVWKIQQPRLIMSILGGAKYFTLAARLESNFINGIIDVARSSDAWLVTSGYNVGIVQVVGQAIKKASLTDRKRKLVAIGVCKWGSVKDVEIITKPQDDKQVTNNDPSGRAQTSESQVKRRSGECDPELNHTHYLMLDDGRLRYYDTGDYRTRLCLQLAKYNDEVSSPTPLVTIVVEGGKDTIKNMYYDLRANIPVVIIDGSGRVADFFKRWIEYAKEINREKKYPEDPYEIDNIDRVTAPQTLSPVEPIPPNRNASKSKPTSTTIQLELRESENSLMGIFQQHYEQLKSDLRQVLSHEDDLKKSKKSKTNTTPELEDELKRVMYCLQPAVRSSISIFNLDTDTNLSETIFRGICKARQKLIERKETDLEESEIRKQQRSNPPADATTKHTRVTALDVVKKKDRNAQRTELLRLAMDWNCIDVAKQLILKNSLDNILNQGNSFIYALDKNLPEFVYEFLKLGIRPAEVFFARHGPGRYKTFFEKLYPHDFKTIKTTHLGVFIHNSSKNLPKKIENTTDLNNTLREIIGDHMHKLYFDSDDDELKYQNLHAPRDPTKQTDAPGDQQHLIRKDELIIRDLFIWAVLYNYIDMAKVFLAHIKYRICAALIATDILKKYHSKASHGALKNGYMKNSEYFEQYAMDCIDQCEKNEPDLACEIVLQRIDLFGYITCLQVASDADDKEFIATPCCVQAIKNVWNDKGDPEASEEWGRVWAALGLFSFGLLAPVAIKYREEATNRKGTPTARLKPCGIDYSDPYSLEYPNYWDLPPVANQYLHRLYHFHRAPRMKYLYRCLFYVFFLLLFSYVMLFEFQPPTNQIPSIDWTEILTIVIVSCMLIEELQYFCSLDNLTLLGKLGSYYKNRLKIMAMLSFILFYSGLILRFTVRSNEADFPAATIVMAIALEIFWLRSLAFIIVIPFLGPHLVAIGKMLKDLLFFMCLIAVVMTGYGVASRSMVYYPHKADYVPYNASLGFDGRSIFRDIAYPVYYMMYGEVSGELQNLDQTPDAGYSIATHVLLAIHVLFVNILLTNLLIAMFSKRFEQVYDRTRYIWHSQVYLLTREYYSRAPLFPPFSVLYDTYRLIRMAFFFIRTACDRREDRSKKTFKMIAVEKEQVEEWGAFEGASTYEYAHKQVKESRENITASMEGSDARATEKRKEIDNASMTSHDSADDMKKTQDLAKFSLSLDEIKQQLSLLLTKSNATSSNESRQRTNTTAEQNRT